MLIGRNEWDIWKDQPTLKERNLAFRNEGDLKFTRVDEWGLGRTGVSLGAATADFDNDGDLDLVVSNVDAPVSIYRNRSHHANAVRVRLAGGHSNRQGLGATIQRSPKAGLVLGVVEPGAAAGGVG